MTAIGPSNISRIAKASCTECRRRKQKCNRKWPCDHCSSRRIAHLCRISGSSSQQISGSATANTATDDGLTIQASDSPFEIHQKLPSLSCLGYADQLKHFNLDHLMSSKEVNELRINQRELGKALQSLPFRSLIDQLVQNYLQNGNYMYYSIHPETFQENYSAWCIARAKRLPVSPAFTGLLLQICANSAQTPTDEVKTAIEYDLFENTTEFSERLQAAAGYVGNALSPGTGGLDRILQLLLRAAWLKADGKIIESWHTLAVVIREEQECGVFDKEYFGPAADIEAEIRTRIWCFTVLWDWQMAEWLSRPMLIDLSTSTFRTPNLQLDCVSEGSCSPIASLYYQCRLVYDLARKYGRISAVSDTYMVQDIQDTIEAWMLELPTKLQRIEDSEVGCEELEPWLVVQRAQINSFAQMVKLSPMKQFMVKHIHSTCGDGDAQLFQRALDCSFDCLRAALTLYDALGPSRVKFHFAIFALFDTSTTICSAAMHNPGKLLARRSEVENLIGRSLGALQRSSAISKCAANSFDFLKWLATKGIAKIEDTETSPPDTHFQLTPEHTVYDLFSGFESISGYQSSPSEGNRAANMSNGLNGPNLEAIDLDGMELIWDWNQLDIEKFMNQFDPVQGN